MSDPLPLRPVDETGIPIDENRLLERIAMIDQVERVRLAMAVLGPRPSPDTPLAPVLRSILLLHAVAEEVHEVEQERLLTLVRAIAESRAIRDHEREHGGESL